MRTLERLAYPATQPIDLHQCQIDRLVRKIFDVFDMACDLRDLDTAQDLLASIRAVMARHDLPVRTEYDEVAERFVGAHYRLSEMRCLVQ